MAVTLDSAKLSPDLDSGLRRNDHLLLNALLSHKQAVPQAQHILCSHYA